MTAQNQIQNGRRLCAHSAPKGRRVHLPLDALIDEILGSDFSTNARIDTKTETGNQSATHVVCFS